MRGYAAIGLHGPKDNLNIGEVLRAASAYNAVMVAASGSRYKRAKTDKTAATRHLPLLETGDLRNVAPYGAACIAVDLVDGAQPLPSFVHPESAFYVFGPEDGTLGDDVLSWCPIRVYVPTSVCMNLAATVNVVLYDRMAKRGKPAPERIS